MCEDGVPKVDFKIDIIKQLTGIRLKYFIYLLEKELGVNMLIHKVTLKSYMEFDTNYEQTYYLVEYHGGKLSIELNVYEEWKIKYPIENVILG